MGAYPEAYIDYEAAGCGETLSSVLFCILLLFHIAINLLFDVRAMSVVVCIQQSSHAMQTITKVHSL